MNMPTETSPRRSNEPSLDRSGSVQSSRLGNSASLAIGILALVAFSGCANLANIIYMFKGRDAPAEYAGLVNKKVAVVVASDSGSYRDATAVVLATQVHDLLANHVKKIQMANQEEVQQVLSDQPAGPKKMERIARDLGVEAIVAIEVKHLKLKEGSTLYRGEADCSVAVYQEDKGDVPVFSKTLPQFVYPATGVPVTDMDEPKFRGLYLQCLAIRVARVFHPYDPYTDFGMDAAIISATK